MREISPDKNASTEEFLAIATPESRALAARVRGEKSVGTRPRPSNKLIDRSSVLSGTTRRTLLDMVARLTDENLFGRSEMCIQFAVLLHRSLVELGVDSRVALGTAMYFDGGNEVFRWEHAWVRIGIEVLDGNTDILYENPVIPQSISIAPYWGAAVDVPGDRRLREGSTSLTLDDDDVERTWWPELRVLVQNLKTS